MGWTTNDCEPKYPSGMSEWRSAPALRWLILLALMVSACQSGMTPPSQPTRALPPDVTITPAAHSDCALPPCQPSSSTLRYPRIANLWGLIGAQADLNTLPLFDLLIPYRFRAGEAGAAALRSVHPGQHMLLNLDVTHGRPQSDELARTWQNSPPGTPGYACLLRDSRGEVLLTLWRHPMYNLTVETCRAAIVEQNLSAWRAAPAGYDGIYWDLLFGEITWLGEDIDSDLDGKPDDPQVLNAAYRAGVEDILTRLREQLPGVLMMGNEAAEEYDAWIDGRLYEWQIAALLNGADYLDWTALIGEYRRWGRASQQPLTTLMSAPEAVYGEKFGIDRIDAMPDAMMAEAAASYSRMRFGLASALMGDGLFAFDLGPEFHGQFWLYDEYGALPGTSDTLPPPGYLGRPESEPFLLDAVGDAPNMLKNGTFEAGTQGWQLVTDASRAAAAQWLVEPGAGPDGKPAVHAVIQTAEKGWDVRLSQTVGVLQNGQSLTITFWARSDAPRTLQARLAGASGLDRQVQIDEIWRPYTISGVLEGLTGAVEVWFNLGEGPGEVWLADVHLTTGEVGVWARHFEHGLAVVNTTRSAKTLDLPGRYCRLNGAQAPLYQTRMDDDEAELSGAWQARDASDTQFGLTVHRAAAGSTAAAVYKPALAAAGRYEVLAWVAPAAGQSRAAPVTVYHNGGQTAVTLDQSSGEAGWRSLGEFDFPAGEGAALELHAAADGAVTADAFKWVSRARYNDGSPLQTLTLQAQDGIILLSACYQP